MKFLIRQVGLWSGWITLLLVALITIDVLLRYTLDTTRTWIIDLEWHLFSLIFLGGAAYTWLEDKHVRVDLFYQGWSTRTKAIVNILGTLFFLLPWCGILIVTSWNYTYASWSVGEGSPDPNGLAGRYLIKSAIVAGFLLLFIAGIVRICDEVKFLLSKDQSH